MGVLIGLQLRFETSGDYRFVKRVAKQFEIGSTTIVISGIAVGIQSTAIPILLVCVGIFRVPSADRAPRNRPLAWRGHAVHHRNHRCHRRLRPTIADNAGGILEMARLVLLRTRQHLNKLDSVGNPPLRSQIGKGLPSLRAITALSPVRSPMRTSKLTTNPYSGRQRDHRSVHRR